MKITKSLYAAYLMAVNTKRFFPEKVFGGKRVAIIGAADTAFDNENGDYIDSFDIVVRVNKAIYTWMPEHEKFIGKKCDVLFHSFYENESSGGGPVDFSRLKDFGVKYLVNPDRSFSGYTAHLNFYKRHLKKEQTHHLSLAFYKPLKEELNPWIPTVGLFALNSVLNASCKEVYISGFTFFKTPYASGYRDHLKDMKANEQHLRKQARHHPELEYKIFLQLLQGNLPGKVNCDEGLQRILEAQNNLGLR